MLYFVAGTWGFLHITDSNSFIDASIHCATPFTTFEAADAAAKKVGMGSYAILSNCVGG
jgi:hypothetical protein